MGGSVRSACQPTPSIYGAHARLIVMDKLLQLKATSAGLSICGLYLGGAAHADDVRAIASSASVTEEQGQIIHDFAVENGLKTVRKQKLSRYLNPTAVKKAIYTIYT